MADISILSRLLDGVQRNVNLSSNTLVVGSLKVGTVTPTELTKAILDRLVSLQNGSDVDATYHTHDGRYFTEAELSASAGPSGSDLIGDDDSYSNFTPTAATVKGALEGIDSALAATADEKVGITAADTTPGYLAAKIQVDTGTNASVALEESVLSPGGDETLRIRFDASKVDHGALAGLGDDDHTIYTKADGTRAFTADQSMGGNQLTNVADPLAAQDAATKAYVDAVAMGLKPKAAARAASLADVDISSELEDGDVLDGVTLATGDRVLLKDQADATENGIYIVAVSGAASRAPDFDSLTPIDEINGAWLPVQEGTQAGHVYVQVGVVATIGTDDIVFTYWDPIAGLVGGDMITKSGNNISVDLAADAGLESSNPGNAAGQLRVKLDGGTLARSASGTKVADGGITGTQLNASVAGDGLDGGGGSALSVNVTEIAGSGLENDGSNNLRIAAAAAGDGLQGGGGSALAVDVSDFAGSGLEDDGSENLRIAASAAGAGLTGGAGAALSVVYAPRGLRSVVAGESMTANTSFLVRWAVSGETAGRAYKADKNAATTHLFYAWGVALKTSAVSAGDAVDVTFEGSHALGSSDTPFSAGDIGKAVYLTAAGAFSVTAPSATDEAVWRVGTVQDVNTIWVGGQQLNGIN